MSDEKRRLLLNVFGKLKQKVLWKWETEQMEDKPANVKLSKWLPQQDILAHKNTRLFVTHSGQSSTQETLCHGTPVVSGTN
jgi:glucuronosyltransferase